MDVRTGESRRGTEAGETTVRRPFSKDFPSMLEISNWATCHTTANFKIEPERLDHWADLQNGRPDTHPWFVAERGGIVVGFAMASSFKNRCGFAFTAEASVYIDPDHVGTGIGSALYAKLISTLAAQGYRTLIAVIATPNPGSVRLHEQFGFRKVGVLSQVGWKFGKWHDVAYWQLTLRDDDGPPDPIKTVAEALSQAAKDA